MGNFKFKQFTIEQENSAMRVNTDGVLLGAWMNLNHTVITEDSPLRLLDIGTGTGVIAIMVAQRLSEEKHTQVLIDALEIDENSHKDAVKNFQNSPWGSENNGITLTAHYKSLQEYAGLLKNTEVKYSHIFSNPPYFIDSLKASEESRSKARHTDTLSQSEIIKYSLAMLQDRGRLSLILPTEEAEQFLSKVDFLIATAKEQHSSIAVLHPCRICKIRTTAKKAPKRYLMEFELINSAANEKKSPPLIKTEELIIMSDGDYTTQYQELTSEFYLIF